MVLGWLTSQNLLEISLWNYYPEVNEAGDLCAICQEKMLVPVLLCCKHIFCEDCASECKTGRPPTRKLEDRKSCTRQKHTTVNAAADFSVGSDDGHEELLAAANAVGEVDMAFLKQQVKFFIFFFSSLQKIVTCLD